MKTLLSLFDYSGTWSLPFAQAGWQVFQWDIQLDKLLDVNNIDCVETALDLFENVDGIIAAAPCTDFASSGARWFAQKDADGRTQASIQLVKQVQRLANLFIPTDPLFYLEEENNTFFWAVENPVGRIATLIPELGKPYYFQPYQFAGHINLTKQDLKRLDFIRNKKGKNVSTTEREFIVQCNAYTKKTGLWGDFNHNLQKKPVQPVMGNKYGSPFMSLGGKSEKTKKLRSNTPQGFAYAFFQAQQNHKAGYEHLGCDQFKYSDETCEWEII